MPSICCNANCALWRAKSRIVEENFASYAHSSDGIFKAAVAVDESLGTSVFASASSDKKLASAAVSKV